MSKQSKTSFWHKLRYKTVVVSVDENNNPTKTIEKKRSLAPVYALIYIAIFCLSFLFIKMPKNIRWDQFKVIFSQLFVPSKWSLKTYDAYFDYLFNVACKRIWQTLEMVFIATLIGVIFAIPLYILASSNIVRKKRVYLPVRIIVNIFRTIPTFVLAIIATIFFGFNETAGIFAMAMFTTGVIFKLMYEYIETVDMNPFEVSTSNGANRLQSYWLSISPLIRPTLISNIIYTFEINVRASVILGFVSAGGIGQLLSDAISSTSYDKVGAILIPLFIVVVFLQLSSSYLRRKIS